MLFRAVGNVRLFYPIDDTEAADAIAASTDRSLRLAEELWGLASPEDCRIYVMSSWMGFFFRSAPWAWRLLLGATVPLWAPRARRTWPYSAAWTQRYGRRTAIGVKPPRLLAQSDRRIGVRVFVEQSDQLASLKEVTCHELVHACSAHLRLPSWLNEGIATVTVDRLVGRRTIREETLELLRRSDPKGAPPTYRQLSRMDLEAIAYHAVRGYWIVHYLEATCPGLVRRLLSPHQDTSSLEEMMAGELGLPPETFWQQIDDRVATHFGQSSGNAQGAVSGCDRGAAT
jgi:hypothetical protein